MAPAILEGFLVEVPGHRMAFSWTHLHPACPTRWLIVIPAFHLLSLQSPIFPGADPVSESSWAPPSYPLHPPVPITYSNSFMTLPWVESQGSSEVSLS